MAVKYGSLSLALRTCRCRFFGAPDYQRWKDLQNFEDEWEERTKLIARLIPGQTKVLEFGAGKQNLKSHLDKNCMYYPSDLVERGPGTIICDLNARPLPDLTFLQADIAVFAGVLEYLVDLPSLACWLSEIVPVCIASYECAYTRPGTWQRLMESIMRTRDGWVNTFNEVELETIFQLGGFTCGEKLTWSTKDGDERLFVFRSTNYSGYSLL